MSNANFEDEDTQPGIRIEGAGLAQQVLAGEASADLVAILAAKVGSLTDELRRDGLETRDAIHALVDAVNGLALRFDAVLSAARSGADHALATHQLVSQLPCRSVPHPHRCHEIPSTIPPLDA